MVGQLQEQIVCKLDKEDPCSAIMAADQDSKIDTDACPADTGDFADNAGEGEVHYGRI